MSLSGLRNLHSYDHQWSVDHGWGLGGCSQDNPGVCVLQAGTSKKAMQFLTNHGFDESKADQAEEAQHELFDKIDLLGHEGNWMTMWQSAESKWNHTKTDVAETKIFVRKPTPGFEKGFVVRGHVRFETGQYVPNVKAPISEEE